MKLELRSDTRITAFLSRQGTDNPADAITKLCTGLIEDASATVPINLEMLASFRNAKVAILEQEQAETIMWDGRHFVIRVRRRDTEGRQRFSCAHAVIHTYFMEIGDSSQLVNAAPGSWNKLEEDLCDQGASELLLPRTAFIAASPVRPDMTDVLNLADIFKASAEATARRLVKLSATPTAMVVLEPGFKPTDLCRTAGPRLRVQSSCSYQFSYIPKYKSVGDSTPLANVIADRAVDYIGETGIVPGQFRVSARLLPVRRDGVITNRVVALLFDPDVEWSTVSCVNSDERVALTWPAG